MKRCFEMIGRLLLMVAVGVGTVACAPTTRPLEHSPGELAWDAWLQQGSRQAAPPRRITTKSLFVFPHLGPESLPACAEGYRPDSMGRCVKVVKVNENAHLEFLLQKLNQQFATETSEGLDEAYDYDVDTEAPDTSGPFQFNIPLALPVFKKGEESSEDTDEIVVTKKQPLPPKRLTSDNLPTSSPEVVPEYNDNDRKQFFLDSTPAGTEGLLQQNHSASSGSVSILLRNSTETGVTLLAPTNGKFENLTSEKNNKPDATDLIRELENVKVDIIKKQIDESGPENLKASQTTINPVAELPPRETAVLQSGFVNNANHKFPDVLKPVATSDVASLPTKKNSTHEVSIVPNSGFVQSILTDLSQANKLVNTVTTEAARKEADVYLVHQIEALKATPQPDMPNSSSSIEKNNSRPETALSLKGNKSSCSDCQPNESSHVASPINPVNDKRAVDLEEKIKKISQFADVSRNSDERGPTPDGINAQKETSGEQILFPSSLIRNGDGGLDLNKAASSSSPVRFPANYETIPAFQDSALGGNGVPPAMYQQPYQPVIEYQRDRNFQDSSDGRPPYWLPYGWNVNNPSGEHNLMDLWSRMSSMQRYPYDVRFENQPPARLPHRQQTLFPNSRESGGRLNVRHTPVNYRQGRDSAQRRRQVHQDESMNYKRSRHPHFRESEELSRIIEAFNGR